MAVGAHCSCRNTVQPIQAQEQTRSMISGICVTHITLDQTGGARLLPSCVRRCGDYREPKLSAAGW